MNTVEILIMIRFFLMSLLGLMLGGWKTLGVRHRYRNDYPLEVLGRWLEAMTLLKNKLQND